MEDEEIEERRNIIMGMHILLIKGARRFCMELGYAFLVLLLYLILVLVGIWVYEYWEKRKEP